MKNGLVDIDWKYVGAALAREGDTEQVQFFQAFVKECNSWGTRLQVEQQLAYVNQKLMPNERKALSMLSYEEKEP